MKSLPLITPVFLLAIFLLGGCATRYQVRVDSLSDPATNLGGGPQTYALVSDIETVKESDLFFKEVARYLRPILEEAGYRPVAEGGSSDVNIGVKAYMSDPLVETRQYSEPVYIDQPGYVSVVRVPVKNKSGKVVSFAYTRYYTGGYYGFGGYVDHNVQYTVYDKILELSARPVGSDGEMEDESWSLKVSMRSRSTDYRSALPYLAVAAEPFVGRRTDGEEVIILTKDSPEVLDFKESL